MKKILIALLLAPVLTLTAQTDTQRSAEKLWETAPGLITPESVLHHAGDKIIYVANINENPWEKDGNGFISVLSESGEITNLKWATGLDAPKGMGVVDEHLYVTNIDEVVKIDRNSGKVLARFGHPLAENLNDIAVSPDNRIFISDSKGSCIFELKGDKLEILLNSTEVKASNGLCVDGKILLAGQRNRIAAIDLETMEVTTFISNTGSIDGLVAMGDGTFLISDWSGKIQRVSPSVDASVIFDSTPDKVNAADIDYNPDSKTLYVPTFFHNSVTAWKVSL